MITHNETKKGIKALQNNQLGTKPKITQTRDEALKLKQTRIETQLNRKDRSLQININLDRSPRKLNSEDRSPQNNSGSRIRLLWIKA